MLLESFHFWRQTQTSLLSTCSKRTHLSKRVRRKKILEAIKQKCKGGKKLRFGKVERYEPTLTKRPYPKCVWVEVREWEDREALSALECSFLSSNCREFLWRKQLAGWKSLFGEIFGNWQIVQPCWFSQGLFTSFSAFPGGLFVQNIVKYKSTRWWFQIFLIFTPTWGNDPIWRSYFSDGLVQHPTRSLQQYLTPWIRPQKRRFFFKEGWRAARPALSTWRFFTTGTDGLDDFYRLKDAFQGWKDAMPKDWTGG